MLPPCYKEPAGIRETWRRGGRLLIWSGYRLATAAVLATFIFVCFTGILLSRFQTCCGPPNTNILVAKIANEAYVHWTYATGERCPSSLGDLARYRNKRDTKDGWGNELVMVCDPSGTHTPAFGVYSLGPDGVAHTGDDIISWDETDELSQLKSAQAAHELLREWELLLSRWP